MADGLHQPPCRGSDAVGRQPGRWPNRDVHRPEGLRQLGVDAAVLVVRLRRCLPDIDESDTAERLTVWLDPPAWRGAVVTEPRGFAVLGFAGAGDAARQGTTAHRAPTDEPPNPRAARCEPVGAVAEVDEQAAGLSVTGHP